MSYSTEHSYTASSTESANQAPVPPLEVLEEYKIIMENAVSLSNRRQTLNNVFVSINSIFLSGLGFLLATSHMDSWSTALATAAVTLAILPFNLAWRHSLNLYSDLLATHYACLEQIETKHAFAGNINTLLAARQSTTGTEIRLATYFLMLYPVIVVIVGILTYLISIHVIPPLRIV